MDLKKLTIEEKTTLYEIERHCNNYFNPQNDPKSKIRKYPDAFLELVCKIIEYKKTVPKNISSFQNEGYSETYADNSWQKAFAPDLAIYKRVRFI